jgi:hypothetical protein
MRGGGAHLLF